MRRIKQAITEKMNRVPLWAEFTLFLAIIMILLTVVLSWSIYSREQKRTIDSQMTASRRLLNLKMTILDEYMEQLLSSYAILPVYDSSLYSTLLSTGELSDETIENIRSTVRTYYYSRSDLLSYHIYLLNHDLAVGRNYGQDGIRVYGIENMEDSELYKACASSRKNYAIFPSDNPNALFHFVHSIIRVQNRQIVALTDFEVDRSDIEYLSSQSISPGEVMNLYSMEGDLLYTDAKDELKESLTAYTSDENINSFFISTSDNKPLYCKIGGITYLLTMAKDSDGALVMTSLIPLSDILSQIKQTRLYAVMIGLIFLILAVAAAYILIRYLSAPLSALVKIQESFGEGMVSTASLGRSRESAELSRSFNNMTQRIDTLIKENYAAELNEKNARLATLEAQLNPHFLYNTLQAIGSEALLNDQTEIYNMIISLASNLRYSIKAPNVVSLKDELTYVDNYIKLQKIRMENRLTVEKDVDNATLSFMVPKICIQTLIENSIIHGIGGDRTSIHIKLTAFMRDNKTIIRVQDNGIGISPDELEKIRHSFHSQTLSDSNQSIGLANLYNRILLLYGDTADMQITSESGKESYTVVILTLPELLTKDTIPEEEKNDI